MTYQTPVFQPPSGYQNPPPAPQGPPSGYEVPPAPQGPPSGYPGPPYGYPAPPPPQGPPTCGIALVSMILSIKSIFLPGVGIAGAILGHKARSRIRRTGEKGDGFAKVGIAIGWTSTGLWALFVVLEVLLVALAGS